MWTTDDVKKLLRNCSEIRATIQLMEEMVGFSEERTQHQAIVSKLLELKHIHKIVTVLISYLPREERFVVNTHIIDGLDWAKTIVEYEKKWGYVNGRSERTLKRISAKAVQRIANLLNHLEIPKLNNIEEED